MASAGSVGRPARRRPQSKGVGEENHATAVASRGHEAADTDSQAGHWQARCSAATTNPGLWACGTSGPRGPAWPCPQTVRGARLGPGPGPLATATSAYYSTCTCCGHSVAPLPGGASRTRMPPRRAHAEPREPSDCNTGVSATQRDRRYAPVWRECFRPCCPHTSLSASAMRRSGGLLPEVRQGDLPLPACCQHWGVNHAGYRDSAVDAATRHTGSTRVHSGARLARRAYTAINRG